MRWFASQSKALLALKSNLDVMVIHLSKAATRTDKYIGNAKNYLHNLKNAYMLKTMHMLLDILADLLSFFSLKIYKVILLHNH